jgi:hypothetical protein
VRLEIIAVYLAQKMDDGLSLETAMKESLDELDGVFTPGGDGRRARHGQGRDGGKPLVLYESPGLVASRRRGRNPRRGRHEIDTCDPYEREVMVWRR